MDEFRWIQMFSCLMLMIQIAVSVNETSMFMKVGDDVTLPCLNVIDEQNNCDGTTWTFTPRNRETTVELIKLGQTDEEAKTKSDRLSVTANCSLLIKKLTVEDVGLYYCRQYKVEETPSKHTLVHLSLVHLSVITYFVSLRFIIVSVGLAALSITAVTVNMWTKTKGKKTQMDKNTVHYDRDEDVPINYENVGDSAVSIRLH
ncbi:unnamed protein product [Oreochromis niloticus]|nr:unnamed protein product [Mustela putorius furo]